MEVEEMTWFGRVDKDKVDKDKVDKDKVDKDKCACRELHSRLRELYSRLDEIHHKVSVYKMCYRCRIVFVPKNEPYLSFSCSEIGGHYYCNACLPDVSKAQQVKEWAAKNVDKVEKIMPKCSATETLSQVDSLGWSHAIRALYGSAFNRVSRIKVNKRRKKKK
jgi:hypothetical protein